MARVKLNRETMVGGDGAFAVPPGGAGGTEDADR